MRVSSDSSKIVPLYDEADLADHARELRARLANDELPEVKRAWDSEFARHMLAFGGWFQRIEFPERCLTSTSRPGFAGQADPGPLNTLWGNLSPQEGARLRPYPKWAYLKRALPSVEGKSVLEIGSSSGFFSFRFAELGASSVTGVEIVPHQHAQAQWAAEHLGLNERITFLNTDGFLSPSVPQHDVVFMSEVLVHSVVPFFSLLRTINLARELVVIDDFFIRDERQPATLHMYRGDAVYPGKILWTGFGLTEKLLFDFLYLFGVEPDRVQRHYGFHNHTVLVIDTRGVKALREKEIGHPSLRSFLELNTRE